MLRVALVGLTALMMMLTACAGEARLPTAGVTNTDAVSTESRPDAAVESTPGVESQEIEATVAASEAVTPVSESQVDLAIMDGEGIEEEEQIGGDVLLISSEVTSAPEVCKA